MKAAIIVEQGGRKQLSIQEVPQPKPGPGEVVVRVRAAGLNRAELALNPSHRQHGPKSAHPIPGLEFAGEIAAIGKGVKGVKEGDKVMGSAAGTYAEYAKSEAALLMPYPSGRSWAEAACLPVGLQTLHDALITNGRMEAGDAVLIQGASSGVGLIGLQIAKLKGASVIMGGARHTTKFKALQEFGMDVGIDLAVENWPEQVKKASNGAGADLIVDMVAGPVMQGNLQAAAILGRIINVGRLGGNKGEIDFDLHALKRVSYIGVTFRTRTSEEIAAIVRAMVDDLWPDVEAGRIRLPIDKTYTLEQAADAQAHMRANAHLGKIVLTM